MQDFGLYAPVVKSPWFGIVRDLNEEITLRLKNSSKYVYIIFYLVFDCLCTYVRAKTQMPEKYDLNIKLSSSFLATFFTNLRKNT